MMSFISQVESLSFQQQAFPDLPSTSSEDETFEIDIKPKKKYFESIQEKKIFVQEYTKKKKTELCKNFILTGKCKYGIECSFAHGDHELQPKTHLHSRYKTKPCKSYFLNGYCLYGIRCQYIHEANKKEHNCFLENSYQQLNNKMISTQQVTLSEQEYLLSQRTDIQKFILAMKKQKAQSELYITNNSRLKYFSNLTNQISSDSSRKESVNSNDSFNENK